MVISRPRLGRVPAQPQTAPPTAAVTNDGRIFARTSARSRRRGGQTTKIHYDGSVGRSASEKGAFSLPMLMLSCSGAPFRLAHDDPTLVSARSPRPKMADVEVHGQFYRCLVTANSKFGVIL